MIRVDSSTWLIWWAMGARRSPEVGKGVWDDGTRKRVRWLIRRRRRSGGTLRGEDGRGLRQYNICVYFPFFFLLHIFFLYHIWAEHQAACISFVYQLFSVFLE